MSEVELWVYHGSPALLYLVSLWPLYRLGHLRHGFWRWKFGWACFAVASMVLLVVRLFNILNATGHAAPWHLPLQTALVIVAASALFLGSVSLWSVFRDSTLLPPKKR